MPMPEVPGVTHRWITVRGVRLHVAEAGSGPDVVLLLHGFPQHWYEWRAVMPALADRYRVLALDLRGFGWSDAPPDGYRKEELAQDVLAVLDALELDRVHLLGHDWGGWIALLLCLRAPERIRRCLAVSIAPPWPSRSALRQLWRLWYQAVLVAPGVGYPGLRSGRLTDWMLRAGTRRGWAWPPEARRSFVDVLTDPARARAGVQMYRTFVRHELVPVLTGRYARVRLTVPTRLLVGRYDGVIHRAMLTGRPSHAEDLQVELVPGGHFLVDEDPGLVTARARAFFGKEPALGEEPTLGEGPAGTGKPRPA